MITSDYIAKLSLTMEKINVSAKKINSSSLKIHGMVLTRFLL